MQVKFSELSINDKFSFEENGEQWTKTEVAQVNCCTKRNSTAIADQGKHGWVDDGTMVFKAE